MQRSHWMLVRERSFNILWFHACLPLSVTILCLLRSTTEPKCQLHHCLLMPSSSTFMCEPHTSLAVRNARRLAKRIKRIYRLAWRVDVKCTRKCRSFIHFLTHNFARSFSPWLQFSGHFSGAPKQIRNECQCAICARLLFLVIFGQKLLHCH